MNQPPVNTLPKEQLKPLYNDVIKGFSISTYNHKHIYIKHLSTVDAADFDIQYNFFLEKAKAEGAPTTEEKEKLLIQEGSWSKDKDKEVANHRFFLDGLRNTKAKLFRQAEIEQHNKIIQETEKKINDLERERAGLLSCTAESFATKKLSEYQIFKSLYLEDLKTPFFTFDQFDNLKDTELVDLINSFNDKLKHINEKNLKRIALAGFFTNFFYLCKDNPHTFFGKPVIDLTFFQAELFGHALHFKNILSNSQTRPSPEILEDPDKLIDWHNGVKNIKEQIDKGKKPEDIVGLSSKDRELYGIQGQAVQHSALAEMARKKGGSLNFNEIIKVIK